MEKEMVTIRAEVIRRQEKVLTLRLEDGFGNAEVIVYQDNTVAA